MHNNNRDVVPFKIDEYDYDIRIARRVGIKRQYYPQPWKVRKYVEITGDRVMKKYSSPDIYWDRIVEIEYIGEDDTYDLHVMKNHNFVIDGVVVHNSTITALKALWRAWTRDDEVILVVSPTFRQSQLLFNKIRANILREDLILSDVDRLTMHNIEFNNGSSIHCLPAVQENIRGFTATMIIVDEAAFVDEEVFAAIEPALAVKDGTLILLGTPFEPSGYFYRAWTSPGWSKYHVTSYDNPYIKKEFIEQFKVSHSEIEFKREILGEFVESDIDSLFTLDMVQKVMKLAKLNRPQEGYRYVMGVDLARFGSDWTAVAVLGVREGEEEDYENAVIEMHGLYKRQKRPLNETLGWLLDLDRKWNPDYIYVDANGLGAGVFDIMKEKLGGKVKDVQVRGKERVDMYLEAKRLIEEGRVLLIKDNDLLAHFLNYEVRYRSDGQIRVIKKPDGHDDLADATIYAIWGIVKEMHFGNRVYVADFDLEQLFDKMYQAESKRTGPVFWMGW